MIKKKVMFDNGSGLELAGILQGKGSRGVVVCPHFTGTKEIRHYHNLADAIVAAGLSCLRFDYGDCLGESKGSCDTMSLSHQVLDTFAAMDFLRGRGMSSVGLFGHSLGGTTALIAGANDRNTGAVVCAGAPSRSEHEHLFTSRKAEWEHGGIARFSTWNKGEIRIGRRFLSDIERYDASRLVRALNCPLLVIHAQLDGIVTRENADEIYLNASGPKQLSVIEGADHMLSDIEGEQKMISLAGDWFSRWL